MEKVTEKIILGGVGMKGNSKGYYETKVIAQLFGLSVRRVQQLTQDGVIETTETSNGRRYEATSTIQRYIKYLSDKAYGKSKSPTELQLKEQKLRADIALKESQGELHKIKTDIAAGRYISVEEIKMDYSRFFVAFKKFAMGIPNRLTGRLIGFIDPVEVRKLEKELQKEVVKLLNSFVSSAIVEEKDINGGQTKD